MAPRIYNPKQEPIIIQFFIGEREMINLAETILMGILATLVMDLLSILLGKLRITRQLIEPQVVGRWVLYMLKRKFLHEDIYNPKFQM